ncbi:MAG TPA: sigma-70 family RNA polymerase sigma factor [Gemmataceae bacterium]|nr:sigma-70 family RNA polymerase sigma factor [Gemmataceae bacterium]
MSEAEAFRDLIGRVRSGDDRAAEELVRRYESTIRMAIRVRLDQSHLRRLFDSMDICQSVMANFFVRAASGQFELDKPEQLVKLLVTMARNKLINYVHHQQAGRRDHRRQASVDTAEVTDAAPTPSQIATYRELLEAVRSRLSGEERRLAELRGAGCSWPEIAAEVGENADALRFRLTRALDRVAGELRLED